ncbi:MAG: hypothetical protein RRA45_04820 [Saccharolobus sp.]|uniref:hypothetical protein n=1 Tax=Saccharolobus sp. TaxID=2100761 RepID=UPI0028CEB4D8|nr:hypothetical protein [Saccharolobus sp.]MDT7861515.1 hypothetical protein [Saccharolobus sp.]
MSLKNPELNSSSIYEYINRVIIAVVNSIMLYKVISYFIGVNYVYFIVAISAVVSFFFYKSLSIIVLSLYLIFTSAIYRKIYYFSLYTLISSYSNIYFIEFIILIVLLFTLPLIGLLKFKSVNSVITVDAILLSVYNSFLLLFLPFGVAEKGDKVTSNIISVLPLILLEFKFEELIFNYKFLTILLLIVITGILFGLSKVYSITGGIALWFSLYLSNINLELTTLILIVSILLNSIPTVINMLNFKFLYKKEIIEKRNLISERVKDILNNLDKIKDILKDNADFNLIIQKYNKIFINILDNIKNASDIKTLENLEMETNLRKLELERNINDYIFDRIAEYNEAIDKIKNYGIIMEKIEPLSEPITIDDNGIIKISNVIRKISENTDLLYKNISNLGNSIKTLLGNEYNLVFLDISRSVEYLELLLNRDIIRNCKICDDSLFKFLQLINSINIEASMNSQELLKSLIKVNGEKPAVFVIKSKEIVSQGLDIAIKILNKLKEEYSSIMKEIPILTEHKEFKLVEQLESELKDPSTPLCKRIETLASSLQIIEDLANIIEHKDEIIDVINLVKDNYEIILQKVLEEGCVKLDDLGIAMKYAKFIDMALQEKGSTLRVVNDSICYIK